jgi:hypothetical protein
MQSANRVVSFDAVQRSSARDWGSPKYRCPNGPDTMDGTTHDTKKHHTSTTLTRRLQCQCRHDTMMGRVWAAISTRSVNTNTTRKEVAHLNTTNFGRLAN